MRQTKVDLSSRIASNGDLHRPDDEAHYEGLRARLRRALAPMTYKQIGVRTRTHPETVRRYLTTGTPCTRFLAALVHAFGLGPEWMLLGTGPMRSPARKGEDDTVLHFTVDIAGPEPRVVVTRRSGAGASSPCDSGSRPQA